MDLTSISLVLDYELFWMNNKTIIKFCFYIVWRIMEILDGVIPLGQHPARSS